MTAEKFVLVDWDVLETRVTAYQRIGRELKPLEERVMYKPSYRDAARCAADLCQKHRCSPLIDVTGVGRSILTMIEDIVGPEQGEKYHKGETREIDRRFP